MRARCSLIIAFLFFNALFPCQVDLAKTLDTPQISLPLITEWAKPDYFMSVSSGKFDGNRINVCGNILFGFDRRNGEIKLSKYLEYSIKSNSPYSSFIKSREYNGDFISYQGNMITRFNGLTGKVIWRFICNSYIHYNASLIINSIDIIDNKLYFVTSSNNIFCYGDKKFNCIDVRNGRLMWSKDWTSEEIGLYKIFSNNSQIITFNKKRIISWDFDLNKTWEYIFKDDDCWYLTFLGSRIAFVDKNKWICFNLKGHEIWKIEYDKYINLDLAYFDEYPSIFFLLGNGVIKCAEINTGEVIWENDHIDKKWGKRQIRQISIANGVLVSCAMNIAGFDLKTGKQLWILNKYPTSPLYVGNGYIFLSLQNQPVAPSLYSSLSCIEATSGKQLWEYGNNQNPAQTSKQNDYGISLKFSMYDEDNVFMLTTTNTAYLFNIKKGKNVWRTELVDIVVENSTPIFYKNGLILVSNDRLCYRDQKTGKVIWSKSIFIADPNRYNNINSLTHDPKICYPFEDKIFSIEKSDNKLYLSSNRIEDGKLLSRIELEHNEKSDFRIIGTIIPRLFIYDNVNLTLFAIDLETLNISQKLDLKEGIQFDKNYILGKINTTPLLIEDRIYLPILTNTQRVDNFRCLSGVSFKEVWKTKSFQKISWPPKVWNNNLYFYINFNNEHYLNCFDSIVGIVRWQSDNIERISAFYGDKMISISDKMVYCYNADNGFLNWGKSGEKSKNNFSPFSIMIDDKIFVSDSDTYGGNFYILREQDGEIILQYPFYNYAQFNVVDDKIILSYCGLRSLVSCPGYMVNVNRNNYLDEKSAISFAITNLESSNGNLKGYVRPRSEKSYFDSLDIGQIKPGETKFYDLKVKPEQFDEGNNEVYLDFVLNGALLEDNVYTIEADFGDGTTLTTQMCWVVKP